MFQDQNIREVAEALYDNNLPYHNFGHILYVLSSAENLLAKCNKEQVSVDEKIIYYALLFHDAGYQDNHNDNGFDTKEAYSAELAGRALHENGIDEDIINDVKQAILCTHFSVHCTNNNDRAVKSSDLSGLAADYDFFKANTAKLMYEYEMLSGESMEWDHWKKMAAEKLELYFTEDFSLTSDNSGNLVYLKKARENIQRLLEDDLT